jgi:hypothetical protein
MNFEGIDRETLDLIVQEWMIRSKNILLEIVDMLSDI